MDRRSAKQRHAPTLEPLEGRLCLAASVGWDGAGRGAAALTYFIGRGPSSLSQAAVESAIKTALGTWSAVAAITFTQTTQPGRRDSLDFSFLRIDGAGRTLAQAYYPDDVNSARVAGDVQFDSSERWEGGNSLGGDAFDLVLTAVHEIGHALGLEHSNVAGSVLAASVAPNQSFLGLASSDVTSIRTLYASAVAPGPSSPAAVAPGTDATAHDPPVPPVLRFGRPRRFSARVNLLTPAERIDATPR